MLHQIQSGSDNQHVFELVSLIIRDWDKHQVNTLPREKSHGGGYSESDNLKVCKISSNIIILCHHIKVHVALVAGNYPYDFG